MSTTENPKQSGWADSKTAWKRRAGHNITLPTGVKVRVRFPDVAALIRSDALPQELIHTAFMDKFAPDLLRQIVGDPEKERELLANFNDLTDRLAVEMLVEPKLTLEELRELPQEDLEMLKEIAMRERNTDARGVQLGVVPLDVFATFREAHEGLDAAATEGHPPFPDPGCDACREGMRAFSSLRELLV